MKYMTRFTEEQMVTILREADQRPVPEELCRPHTPSPRRQRFSDEKTALADNHFKGTFRARPACDKRRCGSLEQENSRLKKPGGRSRSWRSTLARTAVRSPATSKCL